MDGVEEEVVAEAPDTRSKGRGKGAKIPLDPDALLDFEGFGKIKDQVQEIACCGVKNT